MKIESYAVSDIGLVRRNNEDVWQILPVQHFFALADGMGGHKAGEVAAKETIHTLCHEVKKFLKEKKESPLAERKKQLKEAIQLASRHVYNLSCESEECEGMGTTLVCFLVIGETLIHAHVGDSRIYRFKDQQLEQLTLDHSLRQELILKGELQASSPFLYRNVITRAMGTTAHVQPDVAATKVELGEIYFLCSDGLTDCVSPEEIQEILSRATTIKEASDNLVSAAKENGGTDNITIVMIKMI